MTTSPVTARDRTASIDGLLALVAAHLASARNAWSLGTFGAVAEFQRGPEESATIDGTRVVTERGGIRIELAPDVTPVAYERGAGHGSAHGVAFCLPYARARMSGRRVLTELGPDRAALRDTDRDATLFDLGLGALQCDCLVRVREARDVEQLRVACGTALLEGDGVLLGKVAAMNPHRVFLSALGRIEVFQAIPAPGGKSPEGPHTHVLPRLLRTRRTHPANLPVPIGLAPCLELHTPGSIRGAVDAWLAAMLARP
jgi:hypothetical protein